MEQDSKIWGPSGTTSNGTSINTAVMDKFQMESRGILYVLKKTRTYGLF